MLADANPDPNNFLWNPFRILNSGRVSFLLSMKIFSLIINPQSVFPVSFLFKDQSSFNFFSPLLSKR